MSIEVDLAPSICTLLPPSASDSIERPGQSTWLIPTITLGIVSLSVIPCILLARQFRSMARNRNRRKGKRKSQDDVWPFARNAADDAENFELQRRALIKKSLASRELNPGYSDEARLV
jgi:hypothetical protein